MATSDSMISVPETTIFVVRPDPGRIMGISVDGAVELSLEAIYCCVIGLYLY